MDINGSYKESKLFEHLPCIENAIVNISRIYGYSFWKYKKISKMF